MESNEGSRTEKFTMDPIPEEVLVVPVEVLADPLFPNPLVERVPKQQFLTPLDARRREIIIRQSQRSRAVAGHLILLRANTYARTATSLSALFRFQMLEY
jgi:hypothetical protein